MILERLEGNYPIWGVKVSKKYLKIDLRANLKELQIAKIGGEVKLGKF